MRIVLVVVALAFSAATSRADEPWANNVSPATQQAANALFAEANQLFAEQAHLLAVEKYRAALALWDHPLIRFNLAVTLIRLDRLAQASEELDRALVYGAQPFNDAQYKQALDYQALLAKRVSLKRRPSRVRTAYVLGGTGIVAVLAGISVGYYANVTYKKQLENGNCVDSGTVIMCNADGYAATARARTIGDVGTVIGVTGGVLVAVAAVIYFTAPRERVVVAPFASRESAGVSFFAAF